MPSNSTQEKYNIMQSKMKLNDIEVWDAYTLDIIINDIDSITDNKGTKRNYYSALLNYIKNNNINVNTDKIHKLIKECNNNIFQEYEENTYNQKQKDNALDWSDIIMIHDHLKVFSGFEKFFTILSLYIYIPPRRVEDYSNLHFSSKSIDDTNHNWLINYDYFIFNRFKNVNTSGELILQVPAKLKQILKEYIETNNIKDNENIFKLTSNAFSQFIKRNFLILANKEITVNMLRHIYISSLNLNELTVKQKREISNKMSHSLYLQSLYKKH